MKHLLENVTRQNIVALAQKLETVRKNNKKGKYYKHLK